MYSDRGRLHPSTKGMLSGKREIQLTSSRQSLCILAYWHYNRITKKCKRDFLDFCRFAAGKQMRKAGRGGTMGRRYGYIRVSTREQNEDRQLLAMHRERIPKKNIYMDKQSGKDFDRPEIPEDGEKTAAGGNRGGKAERSTVWKAEKTDSGRF